MPDLSTPVLVALITAAGVVLAGAIGGILAFVQTQITRRDVRQQAVRQGELDVRKLDAQVVQDIVDRLEAELDRVDQLLVECRLEAERVQKDNTRLRSRLLQAEQENAVLRHLVGLLRTQLRQHGIEPTTHGGEAAPRQD